MRRLIALLGCWTTLAIPAQAQLRIPASTAYLDPNPEGARVSDKGISGWTNRALRVKWFGGFPTVGELRCQVAFQLASNTAARFRLALGEQSREGKAIGQGTNIVVVDFGAFELARPGYHAFTLENLGPELQRATVVDALILSGAATHGAHFNLKPRRNAASVHLGYPVGPGTNVAAFYCEMTAVQDPLYTYYMACGWHRGYFGMQVNSATERRIIFSVWDSGTEAVDRKKVDAANRVRLVSKSTGVESGSFGNEGTGGHSHLVYDWKTGEKQRFIVTAQPAEPDHTVYSGYYFHPERREWMLISSWNAPHEGGWMRGLYSFSENFGGSNGHLPRKARYGNQWIQTSEGLWRELTDARFSHDPTGKSDRLDRFMGLEDGEFFLSHGGFSEGFTASGEKFTRPKSKGPPADWKTPASP
ncbi:MAG: DUF3472 domain-containing protein [Verrucomicrobia bacterium]|nr:DUF3472 domain-containing protein [Verrucomicrobiota bacterium]MBI3867096.1 DUF3472 domain-containing protein [Verrucomicrobiota bacterium]